ncbi:ribosomal lysine N-methyltransferase [Echria macrotheca]|uniref:Ribosomal lysine N-methyltransferase n=1 Tax=Echria macrotheca TaxID=438768 RepID=A0AAJ0B1W3_9PEZI|nr:ribosomal lysine N-methyltransferase [Echria macrotheca]
MTEMEIDSVQDEFARQTQSFMQWFRDLPGATFHKDIQMVDLRGHGAGRGIIATADIEPDTVLFTIPRPSIITTTTSSLATHLPSIFSESESEGDPSNDAWTRLILVLMYEYLRGPSSPWAPYLTLLPASFSTPMFWSDSEIAELQASSVVSKIGRDSAEGMIRSRILPVITSHPSVFFPSGDRPSDDDLVGLAHRCGSAIMAYAFDLDSPDSDSDSDEGAEDGWAEDRDAQRELGMVPMADMLNADAEFNAHIHHAPDFLTATSLRRIPAGEEVLNYYGPLPNGELLRRYGYVTPRHSRYDVVELPWGLVEPHLRSALSANYGVTETQWGQVDALLARQREEDEEEEEEDDETFVIERTTPDPESTGLFPPTPQPAITALPEDLTERVKKFLKTVSKVSSSPELKDKPTRTKIQLETVRLALIDRERQYPTTLEDDEFFLSSVPNTPRTNKEMAVYVRAGEKRLLRETQAWIAAELAKLTSSSSDNTSRVRSREGEGEADTPSAKRRRT